MWLRKWGKWGGKLGRRGGRGCEEVLVGRVLWWERIEGRECLVKREVGGKRFKLMYRE